MMKTYEVTKYYDELKTIDYDYNEYLPENEIRQEIINHEHDQYLEDLEFEDIINNEPQSY